MKVSIDLEACTGHGRCYTLAPEVFGSDDIGYPVPLVDGDIPAELEGAARQAAMNCPERAIATSE